MVAQGVIELPVQPRLERVRTEGEGFSGDGHVKSRLRSFLEARHERGRVRAVAADELAVQPEGADRDKARRDAAREEKAKAEAEKTAEAA